MTSRIRQTTQPQGDRVIKRAQSGFLTGMNLDLPRSEINDTQVASSLNMIPFRTRMAPRSGTEFIGDLPSEGTVHNLFYHQVNKQYLLHRKDRLYISDDLVTWSETSNVTDLEDADSTVQSYGKNAIIFQNGKITLIELENASGDFVLRRFNGDNPVGQLNIQGILNPSSSGPYQYDFVYTFYREVDGVEVAESGTSQISPTDITPATVSVFLDNPIGLDDEAVQLVSFEPPTDADSTQNVTGAGIGAMVIGTDFVVSKQDGEPDYTTQWTGIKIYRTDNLGSDTNGSPFIFNLVAKYTMSQAETGTGIGIGFMAIGTNFTISALTNNISMPSSDWVLASALTTYGYTPIPSGVVGEVTPAFVFTATENDSIYYYTETAGNPARAGYHFLGGQFEQVDDGIRGIFRSPDSVVLLCSTSTRRVSILNTETASTETIAFNLLYPSTIVDEHVGVTDIGTVSFMDQSRFIAVCSDYTVRIWNGNGWGVDKAKELVETEIKKITTGSVGLYSPEGYYILWYRDNESDVNTTKTLRLGLVEDVGTGWTFYGGEGWPLPPVREGAIRALDPQTEKMFLVVIDSEKSKSFQVDTFNGPTGSRFTRRSVDAFNEGNSDIPTQISFGENIASSESFWILHEQTNFFLRPVQRDGSFLPGFEMTAKIYADDNSLEIATFDKIEVGRDVSFDKNILGKRIRVEISTNKADYVLVGTESIFRVQDRPSRPQNNTVDDYQLALASNLVLWTARINPFENITKLISDTNRLGVTTGTVIDVQDQLGSGDYALLFNGETDGIGDLAIGSTFVVR